jgi:hypothetical protein
METKKKNVFTRFLPAYGWAALILMLTINQIAFQGTRLINSDWYHYDFSLPFDNSIPLVKAFAIIYLPVAYAQWIYGFYLVAREKKNICFNIFGAEIIAKLICMACFLIIPTTMVRHGVTGNDPLTLMLRFVYWIDAADNLFPSIHCLESYVLTRGAFKMERCPAWFKWGSIPVTLLVFASTLFTRQHVFVDIIAAVIVVEIGFFISGRIFKCEKKAKN